MAREERAQLARRDREDETPHSASGDERQPKDDERRDLCIAVAVDELRHQREKEESNLGVQNVRYDAVAERARSAGAAQPARFASVRSHEHSDSEIDEIRGAKKLHYC